MPTDLIPVAAFAAGCLIGAYLLHWGRIGRVPLPKLPDLSKPPEEPKKFKPPEVRP